MQNCRLLVVGTPRSGTQYTAKLLQAAGHDVQAEQWGIHGMTSWSGLFADGPWGAYRPDSYILHQIRDPVKTINSLNTMAPNSWRYMHTKTLYIPKERSLAGCIRVYAIWNRLCEQAALWTFRVEDLDPENRLGIPKDTNTRRDTQKLAEEYDIWPWTKKYGNWTWDDIVATKDLYVDMVIQLATKYNYIEEYEDTK